MNGRPLIAEVTNTVSPHTIGDDQPCPAIGTAHLTFSLVDQRSGIFAARWQDHMFIALSRTANDATDYFQIPSGRVVEVGTQVTI